DHLLFSTVTLLIAAIGTGAFLWSAGFPIARRYYLPLLAVVALSAAAVSAALRSSTVARLAVLAGSFLVACAFVRSSLYESKTKFSNCDLAAAAVTERT